MTKSLKKISIVLFVVLLSALLVAGCAFLATAEKPTNTENLENKEIDESVASSSGTTSTKSYTLIGNATEMASQWNTAVEFAVANTSYEVKVMLGNDWVAPNQTSAGFGTGTGFESGALLVPSGATITLNLYGKKLDRNLAGTSGITAGRVICVKGTLNIVDVFAEYNKYTSASDLSNTIVGRITGGFEIAENQGSAIRIASGGIVNMYGGVVYNNKITSDCSIVGISASGTFNMYGGLIAFNESTIGSILGSSSNSNNPANKYINIYAGVVRDNVGKTGAIYVGGFNLSVGAGAQIYDNKTSEGIIKNVYLKTDKKISLLEKMLQDGKGVACVGITMETPGVYCENYSSNNSAFAPRFFKSDMDGYTVQNDNNASQSLITGTQDMTKIVWQWTGTQSGSTQGSSAYVPTGTYTLSVSDGTEVIPPSGGGGKTMTVSGNGIYSFKYGTAGNKGYNCVFMLIIGNMTYNNTEVEVGNLIQRPTGTIASKVYTGSTITCANPTGFDSNTMTITGNTGTNAGTYTAKVTPKTGYVWPDGSLTAVTFSWTITRKGIARPTGTIASQTYTGQELTAANPTGFDSSTMSISGNKQTNANSYKVYVTPGKNWQWADGTNTTSAIEFSWTINRASISKPTTGTNVIPYTGSAITYSPAGYNSSTMKIEGNTGTNLGEYTAKVSPLANWQWSDGTIAQLSFGWRIGTPIAKPTAGTTSFVYNGSAQTYTPTGFNSTTMNITGNTGTNATNYMATITPKAGYCWTDNTASAVTFSWTITRAPIARPTAGTNSFVYNGGAQTYTPDGVNTNTMVVGGVTSATNVNTYTATVTPGSNWQWNDNVDTTAAMSFTWTITQKPLEKPTLKPGLESLVYTGGTLTVPLNGFDSTLMTVTGNTGINAEKNKQAVISLKDNKNYMWADGSITDVSLTWEIAKAEVEKPTDAALTTFIYDETMKTYIPKGFNSVKMTLTDNTATEVGTYTAKVKLKANYQWLGQTEEELSFNFKIVPPGVVVKESSGYDFLWTDSGSWDQRFSYGDEYKHKKNDQELNKVAGENVFILGKVQEKTTIYDFLNNLDSDRNFIKIYDNFGNVVFNGIGVDTPSKQEYIGTSYRVELYVNGEHGLEVLDNVYISILGDINSDGVVNAADLAMMRRLLNGEINLYSLPLERVLSAYMDNKGGLTSVDQELLTGLVTGRLTSNDLFEEQVTIGADDDTFKYIDLVDGRRVVADGSADTVILGNVAARTTLEKFFEKAVAFFNLGTGGTSLLTVKNNLGEVVYNGAEGYTDGHSKYEYIGTGWKVTIRDNSKEYIVSVLGDVTGDGDVNAMDVTYLRRIANDNALLAELVESGNKAILLAATISNRGGICSADSEILWGSIAGTIDLEKYI